MQSSNDLSVNVGRSVADALAIKIQTMSGQLALSELTATIEQVNRDTLAVYQAFMAYVDKSNLQSIFDSFAKALWEIGIQTLGQRQTVAAALTPETAAISYTEPYLYAGGGVGEDSDGIAGITATYPFFDSNGTVVGVYGSDISFVDMHRTLAEFVHTPNSFMYVMTRHGSLIGLSNKESILNADGDLKFANASTSPNILATVMYLQSLLPANNMDYTLLASRKTTNFKVNGVYFQIQIMPQEPRYIIVNGAPTTDYTGNIDAVLLQLKATLTNEMTQIISISVGVFIAMVAVSCFLTYYSVSVPMATITRIMDEAMSFDFTTFKAMGKQQGNFISELCELETVFYDMIEKFSLMVKSNREVTRGRNSSIRNSSIK
ncbi:UNVERIFIED_CONTAM: hypothetical protein HDU68_001206 [Siphonaria sp. JEL0065]|nr:hypothetical protein HDU68_001206 [Siphonaria sp. JEL0065]